MISEANATELVAAIEAAPWPQVRITQLDPLAVIAWGIVAIAHQDVATAQRAVPNEPVNYWQRTCILQATVAEWLGKLATHGLELELRRLFRLDEAGRERDRYEATFSWEAGKCECRIRIYPPKPKPGIDVPTDAWGKGESFSQALAAACADLDDASFEEPTE